MGVKLENVIVGFTCPECENEETAGLDSLLIIGTPICSVCDTEMDANTTADILPDADDEPLTFDFDDIEVGFNGDQNDPWIDVTLNDDSRPEDVPTIVAHVGLQPDDALRLRDKLYSAYLTAKGRHE